MNKSIMAILAVIVIGGTGFFVINNSSSDDDNDSSQNSQQTNNDSSDAQQQNNTTNTPFGLIANPLGGSYRATLTTVETGRTTTGVIEQDSDGDISTTITDQGTTTQFRIVAGETYSQNPADGSWIKYPSGDTTIDTSDLNTGFTQEDIDDIDTSKIMDKGTGPCTAGTCRIFEYIDEDGANGTVKVDQSSGRISDVEITNPNGSTSTIMYEYVDVQVEAPENATEFDLGNLDFSNLNIPQ